MRMSNLDLLRGEPIWIFNCVFMAAFEKKAQPFEPLSNFLTNCDLSASQIVCTVFLAQSATNNSNRKVITSSLKQMLTLKLATYYKM